jgi:hypothetical protein
VFALLVGASAGSSISEMNLSICEFFLFFKERRVLPYETDRSRIRFDKSDCSVLSILTTFDERASPLDKRYLDEK